MVLSASLCIKDEYLVQIERSLRYVVQLEGAGKRNLGVIQPKGRRIQDAGGKLAVYIHAT